MNGKSWLVTRIWWSICISKEQIKLCVFYIYIYIYIYIYRYLVHILVDFNNVVVWNVWIFQLISNFFPREATPNLYFFFHIQCGSMVKIYSLAQFPVDYLSWPDMSNIVSFFFFFCSSLLHSLIIHIFNHITSSCYSSAYFQFLHGHI